MEVVEADVDPVAVEEAVVCVAAWEDEGRCGGRRAGVKDWGRGGGIGVVDVIAKKGVTSLMKR
jgi:hypothetical protein